MPVNTLRCDIDEAVKDSWDKIGFMLIAVVKPSNGAHLKASAQIKSRERLKMVQILLCHSQISITRSSICVTFVYNLKTEQKAFA